MILGGGVLAMIAFLVGVWVGWDSRVRAFRRTVAELERSIHEQSVDQMAAHEREQARRADWEGQTERWISRIVAERMAMADAVIEVMGEGAIDAGTASGLHRNWMGSADTLTDWYRRGPPKE